MSSPSQFTRDTELAVKIETNTKRYEELIKQAIDQIMPVSVSFLNSSFRHFFLSDYC